MSTHILVVDDEAGIRSMLVKILTRAGYQVSEAESGAALKQLLPGAQPDLVLLDLKLPDADGLDLLDLIRRQWPETEVIVLTGYATIESAVLAIKRGAYDFLAKPFEPALLLHSLSRAQDHKRLRQEASALRHALANMSGSMPPAFESPAMKKILRMVERIAPSEAPVLLTGESGTGKEVIADLIHALSHRSKGPMVKVNCAMLQPNFIENDLASSERNHAAGTPARHKGIFQQAENGTLMLDEIAELPGESQARLLRILQATEALPAAAEDGGAQGCRVICTTNRKVEDSIQVGKLRKDLFFRVSTIAIEIPPLRERRDDILPLAAAFLKRFAAQAGRSITGFTTAAAEALCTFDWPGNVRQLQNQVQRAVLVCESSQLDACDLTLGPAEAAESDVNLSLMEGVERNMIVQMLRETGGNKLKTAQRLGIGRQTLYNKIKAYGIEA